MNVHLFDGLWTANVAQVASEVRNAAFEELWKLAEPRELRNCHIIAESDSAANYDGKVDARDLLYALCMLMQKRKDLMPDILDELEIQDSDMSTGLCPQGRTTRLYQILVAFT